MKEWLIGLCSFVMIITIFNVLCVNNKFEHVIRWCLSLIFIIIMIKPLIGVDFTFNETFKNEYQVEMQEDYLDYVCNKKSEQVKSDCASHLSKYGVENNQINVIVEKNENDEIIIKQILIDLTNSVIISDKEHIVIIEEIKRDLSQLFGITLKEINVIGV